MIGMAELMAWAEAPARALGRFDVRTPPKTLDEMFACASERERSAQAIHDMLFGSGDGRARPLLARPGEAPDAARMLAFLAVNSTYRGPYTPGSATCLAFALAVPAGHPADEEARRRHRRARPSRARHLRVARRRGAAEEPRWKRSSTDGDRVTGVELRRGEVITAPIVLSNLDPGVTLHQAARRRARCPSDLVNALTGRRPPGRLRADALRPRRPARVRRAVRVPQPARRCRRSSAVRLGRGACSATSRTAAAACSPRTRRSARRSRASTTRASRRRASTR